VQTHQIQISGGRDCVEQIRSELFVFTEVLEVFVTCRPHDLVVVCSGHPHPAEWLRALRAAGFGPPARRPSNTAGCALARLEAEARLPEITVLRPRPACPADREANRIGHTQSAGVRDEAWL